MVVQWWAIACILAATVLAATAAFLLKVGSRETRFDLQRFHIAPHVLGAIGLYVLSSVFFLLSLAGAPISVIIPLTALEYLWIVLLAARFLHERIDGHKITGVVCIVLGVVLVGLGS